MKKFINKVNDFFIQINNKNVDEYATSCSYYTLLSFIPLIMLIITLTKYIKLDNEVLTLIFSDMFPKNVLNDSIVDIVKEVYSKSVGTITLSAIFVLWSAGRGFFALSKGLSAIYDIKNEKVYKFRIRGIICTIVFILVIILTLLVLVFGNKINIFLQEKFNIFNKIINIFLKIKIIISIIILFIIFTFMYKFVPKHKYKLKYQMIGALFAAISCNMISIFYSMYVDIFTGFSVMYGSLTTVVLAMMWVYGCMYSILIGAMINKKIIDEHEHRDGLFVQIKR